MFGFSIVKPPFGFTDGFTDVMVFTSVKPNGGFTIEKPNILRP